jgi:NACalpha-BTF3-like transcription factor
MMEIFFITRPSGKFPARCLARKHFVRRDKRPKQIMSRTFLLLVLVGVVSCNRLTFPSWVSARAGGQLNSSCFDGDCKLDTESASDTNQLSERIISDWRSADGSEEQLTPALPAKASEQEVQASCTDVQQALPPADAVNILTELGWSEGEASAALVACNNDVADASAYLEKKDEEYDQRRASLMVLAKAGWEEHAAYSALESCSGNATAAAELLVQEEESAVKNFNIAVKDMVNDPYCD